MTEQKQVTYRFNIADHTGLFLGLQAVQAVAIGVGILAAATLLNTAAPAVMVLIPLLAAGGFALGKWQGRPIYAVAPVAASWVVARWAGNHRWVAALPRWTADNEPACTQPDLPPPLAGITITGYDDARTGTGRIESAAVVHDRRDRSATAVVRVEGRGFALCEPGDQDRMLAMWGDALGAFCQERGPVASVRWMHWSAPAGLDYQVAYLNNHQSPEGDDPAVVAYRETLDAAASVTTRHEVLVAVTVAEQKLRRGINGSSIDETVIDEIRLLTGRLENAGLIVSAPLSPAEVAGVFRSRLDPQTAPGRPGGRKRTLTELAGLVAPPAAGPMAVSAEWGHVRVDGSFHASYVVAGWPRLGVHPNWLEPLLLHTGGVRTFAVHYEPVPRSRSQRQIDRDSVKLSSDEEQRHRSGFRVGARHYRATAEVAEREAELVAGFPEFEYVGTLTVAAPDVDALARSCVEFEQAAADCGLELRRLDGQHDLALACCLPVGRGVAPRRAAP